MKKGDLSYTVAKNSVKFCSCSSVLWKVELESNEMGHLAQVISKQSAKGAAQFHLTAYSKMQEKRNDVKTEQVRRKKSKT